ncbi:uncharacterized protein [Physcomitrium patens]|uniref:BZIP domain-containing protein n=1 Tax=Physcomitrium patens TaxID=3218 RepID=A0A2K1L072_PHYPA|nr:basic leucine zipper 63-like [Physcomitrium patens]XP_024399771.1 basic leucine zipper 63-like [Physcomitrium patens]PNR59424.1 hypothetical protein PHYPA_002215 [Physcomitrium patens]|eukprot:XP_024399762.1 basic leucine zipper 63-like [Physcomitrella patens]
MCHGLIEQRPATICIPDLLRDLAYQEPDYNIYVDSYPSVDDVIDLPMVDDELLPEPSSLSDDALADIVKEYSSAVKKLDPEDVGDAGADALGSSGVLSAWLDITKDGFCAGKDSTPKKSATVASETSCEGTVENVSNAVESLPKSRKARKSASKDQGHAQHDSEMDDEAPVLIDEKRKRRMSSNRASAQRSRLRKQGRLDELEILTAQLRLENSTLSRKSILAEQLVKKYQVEKSDLAKKVEELRKELEQARQARAQGSPYYGTGTLPNGNHISGLCKKVDEGESLSGESVGSEMSPQSSHDSDNTNFDVEQRSISSTDPQSDISADLVDPFDLDQFDVSFSDGVPEFVQEEWCESFSECLNA